VSNRAGSLRSVTTTLAEVRTDALACTRCALAEGRTQVVFGSGAPRAGLMFVGEGPGAEEDRLGEPFVGRSGMLLDRLLDEELGMRREQCYIANVVKCRPPDNRDPLPDEIQACHPWLEAQLELVAPAVVVTLGKFASQLLLGRREGILSLRGRSYPFGASVLVPTVHPAYALRGGATPMAHLRADLVRAKRVLAGQAAADGEPGPAEVRS
jgi:DNA polymerase